MNRQDSAKYLGSADLITVKPAESGLYVDQ